MTQEELYEIIASDESYRIELTTSTTDMEGKREPRSRVQRKLSDRFQRCGEG